MPDNPLTPQLPLAPPGERDRISANSVHNAMRHWWEERKRMRAASLASVRAKVGTEFVRYGEGAAAVLTPTCSAVTPTRATVWERVIAKWNEWFGEGYRPAELETSFPADAAMKMQKAIDANRAHFSTNIADLPAAQTSEFALENPDDPKQVMAFFEANRRRCAELFDGEKRSRAASESEVEHA